MSPAFAPVGARSLNVPVFSSSMFGAVVHVCVSSSVSVTGEPTGGAPVAVAMLVNVPAFRSPCVTV
ncbi:hypothetical protein D3C83_135320 [compost metagenome]